MKYYSDCKTDNTCPIIDFLTVSISFSLPTISRIVGLFTRSASTHLNAISMHVFTSRLFASSNAVSLEVACNVFFHCSCTFEMNHKSECNILKRKGNSLNYPPKVWITPLTLFGLVYHLNYVTFNLAPNTISLFFFLYAKVGYLVKDEK